MSRPTPSEEPFAALVVAKPVLAKHGRLRAWPREPLYVIVHDCFHRGEKDHFSREHADIVVLVCAIISLRGARLPGPFALGG